MINATGWRLNCEHPDSCDAELRDENFFTLRNIGARIGWQFGVKLNGDRAIRGGKDYCPAHRKGSAVSS